MRTERKESPWFMLHENLLRLADNLRKHADYLDRQKDTMTEAHERKIRRSDEYEWEIYAPREMNPTTTARYIMVNKALSESSEYTPIFLNDYLPSDARRRYEFLKGLKFDSKVVRFSYTSSRDHLHFLWTVNTNDSEITLLNKNDEISSSLKFEFPKYFSRAMKRNFMKMFGRVAHVKPAVLRSMFANLTGDQSAEANQHKKEINERMTECIDGEDDTLVWDLRLNNSKRPEQYVEFLVECQKYIASSVETAVDDHRHDEVRDGDVVTHLALALNAKDLYNEIVKRCPDGIAIPSMQWLRWQFWPRHAARATSKRYSGRIKVKYMVMARQFRKDHIDAYYASALWKYQKEFSVKFRENTTFVCQDDKHTVKVGEPGTPVAAIDRGKQVLVAHGQSLEVSDHDFCKFSMTPSVSMKVDIPEDMDGNFYGGTVFAGLQDNVFQPSSCLRHLAEFNSISPEETPIECHYHDGGPDHNVRHMHSKLANIAYFLQRNLDLLCSVQTPPYHSWKNPCERCMSLLNIGLQGMGVMRQETKTCNDYLKNANNLSPIRKLKETHPDIVVEVEDALRLTKNLMESVFGRISLKGNQLKTFDAASEEEIAKFAEVLKKIDEDFDISSITNTKKPLTKLSNKMRLFLDGHCKERHYLFSIKKCGSNDCVCGKVRLNPEVFKDIHHLPDPKPSSSNSDKFAKFEEIYETTPKKMTNTFHRKKQKARNMGCLSHHRHRPVTIQNWYYNAKNAFVGDVCIARRSFQNIKKNEAMQLFELVSYSCGSSLQGIRHFEDDDEEDSVIQKLHTSTKLTCNSSMEIPYYGIFCNEPLCYYCGQDSFSGEPR